jgi:hypothetical protein
VGFTDSLRSELLHDRSQVRVTVVHLPAINTPQFEWGRTRLPRHPQPVPPIFQPEVAAEAILWVVEHPEREIHVGFPTTIAIAAQKIAPGLADRYLADTAYDGQQTSDPVSSSRPDNLFEPVPGEFAAHGRFDSRAHSRSAQLWLKTHSRKLGIAAITGAVALAGWILRPRRDLKLPRVRIRRAG